MRAILQELIYDSMREGAVAILGEVVNPRLALSGIAVLGGVGLALGAGRTASSRSG